MAIGYYHLSEVTRKYLAMANDPSVVNAIENTEKDMNNEKNDWHNYPNINQYDGTIQLRHVSDATTMPNVPSSSFAASRELAGVYIDNSTYHTREDVFKVPSLTTRYASEAKNNLSDFEFSMSFSSSRLGNITDIKLDGSSSRFDTSSSEFSEVYNAKYSSYELKNYRLQTSGFVSDMVNSSDSDLEYKNLKENKETFSTSATRHLDSDIREMLELSDSDGESDCSFFNLELPSNSSDGVGEGDYEFNIFEQNSENGELDSYRDSQEDKSNQEMEDLNITHDDQFLSFREEEDSITDSIEEITTNFEIALQLRSLNSSTPKSCEKKYKNIEKIPTLSQYDHDIPGCSKTIYEPIAMEIEENVYQIEPLDLRVRSQESSSSQLSNSKRISRREPSDMFNNGFIKFDSQLNDASATKSIIFDDNGNSESLSQKHNNLNRNSENLSQKQSSQNAIMKPPPPRATSSSRNIDSYTRSICSPVDMEALVKFDSFSDPTKSNLGSPEISHNFSQSVMQTSQCYPKTNDTRMTIPIPDCYRQSAKRPFIELQESQTITKQYENTYESQNYVYFPYQAQSYQNDLDCNTIGEKAAKQQKIYNSFNYGTSSQTLVRGYDKNQPMTPVSQKQQMTLNIMETPTPTIFNIIESKSKYEPDEKTNLIKNKIEDILLGTLGTIILEKPVIFVLRNLKNWSNTKLKKDMFVQDKKKLSKKVVSMRNKNTSRSFCLMHTVMCEIYKNLVTKTTCTKREIYYKDVDFYKTQESVNRTVNSVCVLLNVQEKDLGVMSSAKGLIYGDCKIVFNNNDVMNCKRVQQVPQNVDEIERIISKAEFVLIVEKDTVFQKLTNDPVGKQFCENIILITAKGYPDISTRLLVKKIDNLLSHIPIYILVDADPFGIEIMCTYKFGSFNKIFEAEDLAVPKVRYIGVMPSDLDNLNILVSETTPEDLKKTDDILQRPYVRGRLREELYWIKTRKKKAEIENLYQLTLDFLLNNYIPDKVVNLEPYEIETLLLSEPVE